MDSEPLYEYDLFIGATILFALMAILTYGIARLYGGRAAETLGLRRFQPRALWLAAAAAVAALAVSAALEPLLHGGEKQGLAPEEWDPTRAVPFALNTVAVTVFAPFAEELFYRGLGVKVLGVLGVPLAVISSGLLFGLAHGLLEALPPLVIFGVALAYTRVKYRSVVPAMLAHGAYNALGITVTILA